VRGVASRKPFETVLGSLRPGVPELFVHPAVDTPELRDIAGDWESRVDDHQLVTADAALRASVDAAGATLIGYRELRDLQRTG